MAREINTLHRFITSGAVVSVLAFAPQLSADEYNYPVLQSSSGIMGGAGLVQMPTGRMRPEGEFSLGLNLSDDYRFYTASLQLFPWLETNIRYTLIPTIPRDTGGLFSDKGIDVKLRLLEESTYLPELSVGLRDIGGTGLFDGEYLVATKRYGAFDFTAGLGWGYMGMYNDFDADRGADGQCGRSQGYGVNGGKVDYQRWFTGCMALFGGVEYQSPYAPLRLKLEYDGNDYSQDYPVQRGAADLTPDSRMNVALHYQAWDWLDLRLAFERGNSVSFGFNFSTNYAQLRPLPASGVVPEYAREGSDDVDYDQLASQLRSYAGYQVRSLAMHQDALVVQAYQSRYRDRDIALDRAATVMANNAPQVGEYRIIEVANRLPMAEYQIDADAYQQVGYQEYPGASVADAAQRVDVGELPAQSLWQSTPGTSFGWAVDLDQSLGGIEGFYMYNLGIDAVAVRWLGDSTKVGATGYLNLVDNFDKFVYRVPPDGTGDSVKRVRTLVREYIDSNLVQIKRLYAAQFFNPAQSHYVVAYGGYLERMFGGAGFEYMYRPLDSNWAVGVDLNYVAQRDPERPWQFMEDKTYIDERGQPYTIQAGGLTGHASLYYEPDFSFLDNTLIKASFGQYLAGDRGVTIDFAKQFDSGVIVGAFATKTDLSAEEFGEGSFTKGFYISIPFDLMRPESTVSRVSFNWVPLTRDGGAKLNRPESLFGITDARSPWYGREAR